MLIGSARVPRNMLCAAASSPPPPPNTQHRLTLTYSRKMPGGKRNPLSVSHILEQIGDKIYSAKDGAHGKKSALARKMAEHGIPVPYADLTIQVCV